MPNAQGKGFVDYVLWGDDGKRQESQVERGASGSGD